MKPTLATAYKFLRTHTIAVLATASEDGAPSTTPIHYTVTANKKILFVTKDQTTKYANIVRTKQIAISVVDDKVPVAVNIIGKTRIVKDKVETKNALRKIGKVSREEDLPPVLKHSLGNFVVIEITPDRVQYTDFRESDNDSGQYIFNL